MGSQATAITGATCLAGRDLRRLEDAVVVMEAGVIGAVGPAPSVPVPPGAAIVDAQGLTLIPGFVDAHVHIGFYDPHAVVAGGVTTVRDLGWPPELIWPLAARSRAPGFRGPRITAAGPILTAPGGYPTRARWAPPGTGLEVRGEREARGAVDVTADAGASVIKVALDRAAGPTLEPQALRAIVVAAHRRGLKVSGHVFGLDELDKALRCGVNELAHMLLSSELIPARTIERMVSQDMTIVPTLSIFSGEAARIAIENLRRWLQAGGRVVYGTDLGNSGPAPGIEPKEVRAMLEAGMELTDVLLCATVEAAGWIGLARRGRIQAGMEADIVAIQGDPLSDAEALTKVARVWRAGAEMA